MNTPLAKALAASVAYLESDDALASIADDAYWPKWHAPWWHAVLLFELGEAPRIPVQIRRALIGKLATLPVQVFPIHAGDAPAGRDPHRDSMCHCALGRIACVLAAAGDDPERELPMLRGWFERYQLGDGGYNCDETAYAAGEPNASSIVATVAALEAMLLGDPRTWSPARIAAMDRAAMCLLERELVHGSRSSHNADERAREPSWLLPCFPRFYFYDVLRGLTAVTRWSELRTIPLPADKVSRALTHLESISRDGVVRVGRRAFEGAMTIAGRRPGSSRTPASHFALLDEASVVGEVSPALSAEWARARSNRR